MKLRRWLVRLQLLFLAAACAALAPAARAQERLVMKDGTTREVRVLGVSGTSVQVQDAKGMIGIPLASVAQAVMAAPPQFNEALAAYQAKDFDKAARAATALVAKYPGLPADWAQQAAAMLGDIYVALNRLPEAESAYRDFQKMYPAQGSLRTDVGLARLAVAKKDFASAKQKLAPIAAQALREKDASKTAAPIYGQAFLLLGQIDESEGNYSAALEDYLRTVTLFPNDPLAANAAQEKADALRKARGVTVP
jgi:tetratricopeptide (TPR) repeat protein